MNTTCRTENPRLLSHHAIASITFHIARKKFSFQERRKRKKTKWILTTSFGRFRAAPFPTSFSLEDFFGFGIMFF
jgi:hypothetical protein